MQVAPIKPETLLLVGLAGVAAFVLWRAAKAAPEALATVGRAIDPTSDQNLAYRGVGAVVSAATGREETLGGWLYDLTHADPLTTTPARPRWALEEDAPPDYTDATKWGVIGA